MQIVIVIAACIVFAICFALFIMDIKRKRSKPYVPNLEQPTLNSTNDEIEESQQKTNFVGSIVSTLGVVSVIAGVITSIHYENIVFVVGGGVSGVLILGVGEIISLLQKINDKLQ